MRHFHQADTSPAAGSQESSAERPPIPTQTASVWRVEHQFSINRCLQITPSWLASMVFHLVGMLLLASLVVPLGKHTRLDQLFLSFETERESEVNTAPQPVTLPLTDDSKTQETPSDTSASRPTQEEGPQDQPSQAALPRWNPNDIDWSALAKVFRPPATSKASEPRNRIVRIEPVGRIDASLSDVPSWDAPNQDDEIVDRFIEYDIGRLRGAEGREAVRRFRGLDSRAIPALVRGLNRSARIHASCPVSVISSKLEHLIYQTNDEDLVSYAIRNLGRDVPHGAPHRSRIFSLRRKIEDKLGNRSEQISARLAELGWSVDQQTINRIGSLRNAPASELESLVANSDPTSRTSAVMGILIRAHTFEHPQRLDLGLALADAIEFENDAQRLDLLHQASRALADPSELPPEMDAARWRNHWQHRKQVLLISRLNTPRLLRHIQLGDEAARRAGMQVLIDSDRPLNDTNRYQIAQAIVQDLASPSPDTSELSYRVLVKLARGADRGGHSVDDWRSYWKSHYFDRTIVPRSESYLRQARFLDEGGKRSAAAKHYRKLIKSFPDTPAAREAEIRLQSIIQ